MHDRATADYVRRDDGLYVHRNSGLVGDFDKFSDDARGSRTAFRTALHALHLDHIGALALADAQKRGLPGHAAAAAIPEEHILGRHHLGPGLVTNVGVTALANDAQVANGVSTLDVCKYHQTGTGTTAATTFDIALQTILTPPGAPAGVQSLVSGPNFQQAQSQATLSYTGTATVSEWGLFSSANLSITTGTPFVTTSATGGTVTGAPYVASSGSVRGQTQMIVTSGSVYGLIVSNTTNSLVVPAWYSATTGLAGATPASGDGFFIKPIMWDRKVFSIPVVNGSSIAFSYLLAINAGG
jgi:hypothetical protein